MQKRDEHPYQLTVLTGPNAGAQVPLSGRALRLGAGAECDIQLDGTDLSDARLAFSGTRLRVQAEGNDVCTSDGKLCPAGKPVRLDLPVTLQLDEITRIFVTKTAKARISGPLGFGVGFALAASLFGIVGAAAVGFQQNTSGLAMSAPMAPATVAQQPMIQPVLWTDPTPALHAMEMAAASQLPVSPAPPNADVAAEHLREVAQTLGLTALSIMSDREVVRISGSYGTEQTAAWRELRQAHDKRFGARVAVLTDVEELDLTPPFAVASVWLGETPELVTHGGVTLHEGDTDRSGWTVARIAAGRVELTRRQQMIEIRF